MNFIATILRKSLICLLLFAGQGLFLISSAQWPEEEKEVRLENLPLTQILDSLSLQFHVNFSYNAGLEVFKETKTINKKAKLEAILLCLFKNSNAEFSIIDKQIIIYAVLKTETGIPVKEEKALSRKIKGRVVDSKSGDALAFAAISIIGSSVSTIANSEGLFNLKIPAENLNDSISVSFIGFETKTFAISSIAEDEWVVQLKEYAIQIGAVHIKPVEAANIIKEMLDRIPKNYLRHNAMYTAFYREITSDESSSLSLSEALLEIAKAPYGSSFLNDQARVFRGRKEEDTKRTQKLAFKLEGGIYNSLRLDIVKEEASFLTFEGMKNYDYNYRKVIPYEGRNLHVIDFKGKAYIEDIAYQGTLYIDIVSKALVAAKFEMSPRDLKYARTYLIRKQPKKSNIRPVDASYITFYKYYNGKYYLHYTRAELSVKMKSERLFVNEKFTAVAELAVTDIDTTNTSRFRFSDISKSGEILNERLGVYDDSYWGNYNIISPGKQINEAMETFHKLRSKDEE